MREFKVGDRVGYFVQRGTALGNVVSVDNGGTYPLLVETDEGCVLGFTSGGRYNADSSIVALFHVNCDSLDTPQEARDEPKIAKPNELCFQLIPPEWEAALAHLATKGAGKYAPWDWEKNPGRYMDRIDSARRHLNDWQVGVDYDNETEAHNLTAVAYNCLMVLVWQVRGIGIDNRPESSKEFIESLRASTRKGGSSDD